MNFFDKVKKQLADSIQPPAVPEPAPVVPPTPAPVTRLPLTTDVVEERERDSAPPASPVILVQDTTPVVEPKKPNGDGRKPHHGQRPRQGKPPHLGGSFVATLEDLRRAKANSEQAIAAKKAAEEQSKMAEKAYSQFCRDGIQAGRDIRALIESKRKGEARDLAVVKILDLLPRAFRLEESFRVNAILGVLDLVELRGLQILEEVETRLVEYFGGEKNLPGEIVTVLVALYNRKAGLRT